MSSDTLWPSRSSTIFGSAIDTVLKVSPLQTATTM